MPWATRLASWLVRPLKRRLAEDRVVALVVLVFVASELVTLAWDLPGSHGWDNDGVAPRDLFGGLAHNLTPGAAHRYPLLHYLLLAVLCLPVLLGAVLSGPLAGEAVRARVLSVPAMTGISLVAKVVATFMAGLSVLVVARLVRRTLGVRAGRCAALFAATNLTFAFYGRVSNLDVPYLTYTLLAFDALLDVLEAVDPNALMRFALFAAAGLATKDQAYASFVLVAPLYLLVLPWARGQRSGAWLKKLARGAGIGALGYGLMSGALVNPRGFLRRLDELRGPSSQAWRVYSKDLSGLEANLRDILHSAAHDFWPRPLLVMALAGIPLALARKPGPSPLETRAVRALPAVAGLSSLVFFTLAVARSEHRFVLPLGFFLSAYGGAAAAALIDVAERCGGATPARVVVGAGAAWASLASFAVHLTQLGDARLEVERFLATRPPGTRVETYGLLVYQPHFDVSPSSPYRVTRVGPEAPKSRNPLVGALELQAPIAEARARHADYLVLSDGFSSSYLASGSDPSRPLPEVVAARQKDRPTAEFVRAALANRLPGYRIALVARPKLPGWARALGLAPVLIQSTTGVSLTVLGRDDAGTAH